MKKTVLILSTFLRAGDELKEIEWEEMQQWQEEKEKRDEELQRRIRSLEEAASRRNENKALQQAFEEMLQKKQNKFCIPVSMQINQLLKLVEDSNQSIAESLEFDRAFLD